MESMRRIKCKMAYGRDGHTRGRSRLQPKLAAPLGRSILADDGFDYVATHFGETLFASQVHIAEGVLT